MDFQEAKEAEASPSFLPPVEKHHTAHLVLVPRPSADPRDPLVWQ